MCRIRNSASIHDRTPSHSTIEKALCNFIVAILDDLSLPLLLCSFHLGPTGICYCPGAMVKAARRDATNRYAAEQELLSTFRTSRGSFLDDQRLTSFANGSSTATCACTKQPCYFDRYGHVLTTTGGVDVHDRSVGSTGRHDGALRDKSAIEGNGKRSRTRFQRWQKLRSAVSTRTRPGVRFLGQGRYEADNSERIYVCPTAEQ